MKLFNREALSRSTWAGIFVCFAHCCILGNYKYLAYSNFSKNKFAEWINYPVTTNYQIIIISLSQSRTTSHWKVSLTLNFLVFMGKKKDFYWTIFVILMLHLECLLALGDFKELTLFSELDWYDCTVNHGEYWWKG